MDKLKSDQFLSWETVWFQNKILPQPNPWLPFNFRCKAFGQVEIDELAVFLDTYFLLHGEYWRIQIPRKSAHQTLARNDEINLSLSSPAADAPWIEEHRRFQISKNRFIHCHDTTWNEPTNKVWGMSCKIMVAFFSKISNLDKFLDCVWLNFRASILINTSNNITLLADDQFYFYSCYWQSHVKLCSFGWLLWYIHGWWWLL